MNERLQAINVIRKRLDDKLQAYWSKMFAMAYEDTWSAAHYANNILHHGHHLIDLCMEINALPAHTGRRLHGAWDAAKGQHKEMGHCRNAKTVHDGIPDADYYAVMQYFIAGVEAQCNSLMTEIRNDKSDNDGTRLALLHKFMATVESAIDLELIYEDKISWAYEVLNAYWHRNYTTQTLHLVDT